MFLCTQILFVKKIWLEIALIALNTILLKYTPYQPPYQKFIFMNLFLTVWIFDYLWESLLFERTFLNPSHLWESLLIYDHLWESIFLSLYENKQVYEYHHLKQIFYHQNTIVISCWFLMFQFYDFYFEFFSFCVWLLFY